MNDIVFALQAFSVVFAGMVSLTVILYLVRGVVALTARGAHPPAETSPETPAGEDGITPELMAVLTAAAHAMLGARVRVHRVHIHHEGSLEAWSRAGRMDIIYSHNVGPKR